MGFMEDFGFLLSRTLARTKPVHRQWPHVPGKYFVLDPSAPVAVTTLGSVRLASEVADAAPEGLCIVGKVETENIGIEKIIKNVVANPAISYLICAGAEPPKHLTGGTMLALFHHGMDEAHRIPDAPGVRPTLPNTTVEEVEAFRRQVTPVDMVGCTDLAAIVARVAEAASETPKSVPNRRHPAGPVAGTGVKRIAASGPSPEAIKLDKAGYFVIYVENRAIIVEHYDYQERLLHVVDGRHGRNIYWTLINAGWVSQLDHAAYLGKELARAELSIQYGIEFVQDSA